MPSRLERLRERVRAEGLDALLVSHPPDIRYLCGFTGTSVMLAVRLEGAELVTDCRHSLQADAEVEVHEATRIGGARKEVPAEGMVMTIEPGVTIAARDGVRIEEMVVVEENG